MTTVPGGRDAVPSPLLPEELPRITVAGRSLAGADLREAATAFASRASRIVAVEATATLETVVAVVGALLAGAIVVPVPPDSGPRERAHLLADSRADLWVGRDHDDVAVPAAPVDVSARSSWSPPVLDDGPAMILYTSGTTGAPKGVALSRSAIAAGLDGLRDAWAWTPHDVLVHGLPLFHVHGLVLGVLGALRTGSELIHTGRPDPAAYAAAGGSLYFGVPTVWGRVAADPASAAALRSARLLVSGSAGLPAPVFRALEALAGQAPVERYGMTETLITLAARVGSPSVVGSVGTPLRGVEARLVDVVDGVGELHVRGTTLFDGYVGLGRPLTDDGWFVTGDAASIGEDGAYRIVGRVRDDLIKSGGYRIGAGEIEACLLGHPAVAEAAVIGVPDDDLGQRIVAYVVPSGAASEADLIEAELIQYVAGELSRHKRPREVRLVDSLPRNALGKIQKARLQD